MIKIKTITILKWGLYEEIRPEKYFLRFFINNDHESIVNENIRFSLIAGWNMAERHKKDSNLTVLEKA